MRAKRRGLCDEVMLCFHVSARNRPSDVETCFRRSGKLFLS